MVGYTHTYSADNKTDNKTYNDSPNNYIDVGLFVHDVKQPKNLTLVLK